MANIAHERNERDRLVKSASERSFGLFFGGVLIAYAGLPLLKAQSPHIWAVAAGAVFLLVAAIKPNVLKPLNFLWMKVGWVLERTVTPLIIGVMFLIIFVPFGVALRLTGALKMRAKADGSRASFWDDKEDKVFTAEHFKRQF